MSPYYTAADHFALMPAIVLGLFGCAALFLTRGGLWLLLAGEVFTAVALYRQKTTGTFRAFQDTLLVDSFANYFNWLFLATAVIVALFSYRFFEVEREEDGEYYGLVMLAQSGMYLLATGLDLVTLFVGLELMAVSFYILVGFSRANIRSNEAAVKYLLLGAFSSGLLAYGFSLLYGMTGTMRLSDIGTSLSGNPSSTGPLAMLALATIIAGLLFKTGAAPFHMWTPDAYEGAPAPVTAYLAAGSKVAAFVLTLRLLLGPLAQLRETWEPVVIVAALASLTIGNLAAITQTSVKRMLAYSSIGHAGYLLLGIIAGGQMGFEGVLLYSLVYAFMTLGAFLILIVLRRADLPGEHIEDFAGLASRHPVCAILMSIFLLSLAGIPPTAGFLAKYYIFEALVTSRQYALAVIGALYVVVSLYYYFRVVKAMFMSDAKHDEPLALSWGARAALAITTLATVGIGIYPEPVLRWIKVTD